MGRRMNTELLKSLIKRLNSFRIIYSEDECYGWSGALCSKGYPRMFFRGNSVGANRAAYMALTGLAVPKRRYIRHTCGNKLCTNPKHLFASKEKGPNIKGTKKKSERKHRKSLHMDLPARLVFGVKDMAKKRNITMTKYMTILLTRALEIEKTYEAPNE